MQDTKIEPEQHQQINYCVNMEEEERQEEVTSSNSGYCTSTQNVLLMPPGEGEVQQQVHNGLEVIVQDGCITRSRSRLSLREGYNRVSKKVKKVFSFEEANGPLKRAFMPLYWSLRVTGLTYSKRADQKVTFSMLHSVSVVIMTWVNVGRLSLAYTKKDTFGATLMVKIMVHVWCFQAAVGVTIFLFNFRKHIPELLSHWEKYREDYGGVAVKVVRQKIIRVVIAFWILFIIFTALMVFVFSNHFTYLNNLILKQIFAHAQVHWSIEYIYQFLNMYVTLLYMLPVVAMCILCHILMREYNIITARLRDHVNCGDPVDYIEAIRLRHTSLTKITIKLDDILAGYLLNVYVLDIPILCFNIFVLLFDKTGKVDIFNPFDINVIAQLGSFFIATVHLTVVTIAAVSLTSAAKSPKFILYETDIKQLHGNLHTSLSVFLSRVSSDHIGLTVWKLINVDRGVVITMCTVIVSYVVVLFKFAVVVDTSLLLNPFIINGTELLNDTSLTSLG
jgi:hypothetical protein